MLDTMSRYLQGFTQEKWAYALSFILRPLIDRYSTQPQTSAGLVITGASTTTAKTGATTFTAVVQGAPVQIAPGTNMPALTGLVVAANTFNVACFFVDVTGTTSVLFGTPGATIGALRFPQFPLGKSLIGYLIITSTGTFTGGTTNLDAAGVTVQYFSPVGPFDPTALVG